jgi:hypothetical protein
MWEASLTAISRKFGTRLEWLPAIGVGDPSHKVYGAPSHKYA